MKINAFYAHNKSYTVIAVSLVLALLASLVIPIAWMNQAFANETSPAETSPSSNSSELQNETAPADNVSLEHVVIDGVNKIKVFANEDPTPEKPISVYKSNVLIKSESATKEILVDIPRTTDSYHATFGTSTSSTITPYTEESLWSINISSDKPSYNYGQTFKLSTSTSFPDQAPQKVSYIVDSNDNIIYRGSAFGPSEHSLTSPNASEEYRAVIADDLGHYDWHGKKFSDLTGIKATSSRIALTRNALTATLSIDKEKLSVGEKATLTYKLNYPIEGSKYLIYVVNETDGNVIHKSSSYAHEGIVEVLYPGENSKQYKIYVAQYNWYTYHVSELTNVIAESNLVSVSATPWSINLETSGSPFALKENATLTWTTNQTVSPQQYEPRPYGVYLYDKTADTMIAYFDSYYQIHTGSKPVTFNRGPEHEYIAYVAKHSSVHFSSLKPADLTGIQAVSNIATAERKPWTVSLSTKKQFMRLKT